MSNEQEEYNNDDDDTTSTVEQHFMGKSTLLNDFLTKLKEVDETKAMLKIQLIELNKLEEDLKLWLEEQPKKRFPLKEVERTNCLSDSSFNNLMQGSLAIVQNTSVGSVKKCDLNEKVRTFLFDRFHNVVTDQNLNAHCDELVQLIWDSRKRLSTSRVEWKKPKKEKQTKLDHKKMLKQSEITTSSSSSSLSTVNFPSLLQPSFDFSSFTCRTGNKRRRSEKEEEEEEEQE